MTPPKKASPISPFPAFSAPPLLPGMGPPHCRGAEPGAGPQTSQRCPINAWPLLSKLRPVYHAPPRRWEQTLGAVADDSLLPPASNPSAGLCVLLTTPPFSPRPRPPSSHRTRGSLSAGRCTGLCVLYRPLGSQNRRSDPIVPQSEAPQWLPVVLTMKSLLFTSISPAPPKLTGFFLTPKRFLYILAGAAAA